MTTTPARLIVDRNACAGHGMCYAMAPILVEPDEQGDPVILADPIPGAQLGAADTAVAACPERALSLAAATDDGQ
ncbi:ferredoxin [Nocardia sp. NPDC057227]|uniref:ferredoxin n=1 Tax=Nocardia sp. NPDC057227 TaxID=3346056 RepID=UPI00363186AC